VAESSTQPGNCNFIEDFSEGPTVQAYTQFGNNGNGPPAELLIFDAGGDLFWGPLTPRLDSGPVSVRLSVRPGTATLNVVKAGSSGATSYSVFGYQYVSSVEVGARVIARLKRVAWLTLTVKFYQGGQIVETITRSPECNPIADNFVTPAIGFRAVRYEPQTANVDGVDVTGMIRVQSDPSDPSNFIAEYDLHSEIRVFTTTGNPPA
jgi:hypothetical protein